MSLRLTVGARERAAQPPAIRNSLGRSPRAPRPPVPLQAESQRALWLRSQTDVTRCVHVHAYPN